ncbi:pyrroline-5-carboxylate reductase [Nitzschia inconspicua]|uniref:Pyrroline-5-carboxylate reductase n=1 Tax=Nitzschia inconspicua TaxID=303405 RepID=A0A9K3KI48_9STRA|nr:pyrroline-5-carboxylate reductase [Nitzschia inconspicua]
MFRLASSSSSKALSLMRTTIVDKTTFSTFPSARFLSAATGPAVFDKIAFIGTGKMAQAMINPLIRNGQPQEQVAIYDVSTKAMKGMQKTFPNIQRAESIGDAVNDADMIVLAVKPQNVNDAFWEQFPKDGKGPHKIRDDATLLSICAGVPLHAFVPSGVQKIVRSMPNTPSTISQGMTVWCCTSNLTTQERDHVSRLLHSFGKAIYVDDEKFVDMSTSISGSGPAYIFMLMEAMIDAGVHMGFPRETATTLVYHTLLGSTLYAMETGEHPAILRNSVTSPAGTTASAIYELEKGGLRPLVNDAIWACYRRSLEMGGKNPAVGPGRSKAMGETTQVVHNYHYSGPSGEMKTFEDSDSDEDEEPSKKSP